MYPSFLYELQPFAQIFLEELAKKDKEVRDLKKKYGKTRKDMAEKCTHGNISISRELICGRSLAVA